MRRSILTVALGVSLAASLFTVSLAPVVASAQTTGTQVAAGVSTSAGTQQNATVSESSCSFFGPGSWFANCIWIPLMSWMGSWFLTIGAAFLTLAGVLFDWLILRVVIDFAGTLQAMGAMDAISRGWTIFRDLSNIVIIGMFTFIAIATILGNTEYGYKKMLSRVLIVAVLINFSLLFAKVIIDTGNFTAYQIYQAVAQSPQFSGTLPGTSGGQFDIASAFLKPMGITSIWDTQKPLQQFGQTANSGMLAFLLGLVEGLMLIMLAIVLLYGCFLIFSRAVLLVVLMVTASIAFASHLHPRLSDSPYGWKGWWKSLINASLFGPLLMLFLAISLMIVSGANTALQNVTGGAQNNTFGATVYTALSNPNQAITSTGWSVIMLYIFAIGLLYLSFRLSSSFASSVGGLSIGQDAWNRAFSGAINGISGTGTFFGRSVGGRVAAGRADSHATAAKQAQLDAAQARAEGRIADALRYDKIAGQRSRSAARYGELASGYKKKVQASAKSVAETVSKAQPSAEARKEQAESASALRKLASDNKEALEKNLTENRNQSKEAAKNLNEQIEREIQSNASLKSEHEKNMAQIQKENTDAVKKIGDKYNARTKEINDVMARGGVDDTRRQQLQKQLLETEESRKSELRHQDERLEKARQIALIKTADSTAASAALKQAAEKLKESHAKEAGVETQIEGTKDVLTRTPTPEKIRQAQAETTNAVIDRVASKQVGASGRATGFDNDVAKAARAKLKSDAEEGRLRRLVNKQFDENKGEGDKK